MTTQQTSSHYVAALHRLKGERRWMVYDSRSPIQVIRTDLTEEEAVEMRDRMIRQSKVIEAIMRTVKTAIKTKDAPAEDKADPKVQGKEEPAPRQEG